MRTLTSTLLVSAFLISAAAAEEIRTTDGTLDEPIVSIAVRAGAARLATKTRELPLERVREVRFGEPAPAPPPEAVIVLTSGDELRGDLSAAPPAPGLVGIKTSFGTLSVPIDAIAMVVLGATPDRERSLRLLGRTKDNDGAKADVWDQVRLRTPATAVGSVVGLSQVGLELNVSDQFKVKGLVHEHALATVEAVWLANPATTVAKGPLSIRVRARDGSVLTGELEGFADGTLAFTSSCGPVKVAARDVATLRVQQGRFVDASDLTPDVVTETFPEGLEREALYAWKRDREVMGGHLALGGRTYDRGFGVHSRSELGFAVKGAYRAFRAVIGIDDSARFDGAPGVGSVTFRVLVDGKPRHEWLCRRGDAPREIDVDVTGAARVTLVADYGDYFHVLGRADWLDAHFVK